MVMHGSGAWRGRVAIVTLPGSLVGRPLVEVLPAAQVAVEGAVVTDDVCKDRQDKTATVTAGRRSLHADPGF